MRLSSVFQVFTLAVAMTATPSVAAAEQPATVGFSLRAGGDLTIGAGESIGAAVVLGGDAQVSGRVGALMVVGGEASLDHATVGDLTVVGGHAELRNATSVTGSVRLVGAELTRDDDVEIAEGVTREPMPRWGAFPFGLMFAVGASIMVWATGLLLAAVAPRLVRSTAAAISGEPGKVALSAALLWFLGPPAAIVLLMTLVGIPVGVAVLFALPALALVGYVVTAIVVGERVLAAVRPARRPGLLGAVIGLPIMMLLGAVPLLGALVGLAATMLGSGALALLAWRAARSRFARRDAADVEPVVAAGSAPA